jgi:hypothetical protein
MYVYHALQNFWGKYYMCYIRRTRVAQGGRSLDYLTTRTNLSPIRCGFVPGFVNYKKGYTRLTAASYKVDQLLAHGRWFSPGTPASPTTKTGHHDIAEIFLKVALNTKIQIQFVTYDWHNTHWHPGMCILIF